MKQCIFWEPRKAQKLSPNGTPIEGEFVGKFRTRVPEGTPGAIRHEGQNNAGRTWDYWGKDVDTVAGHLRWIDKIGGDYGTKIVLYFETERFLHRIACQYDATTLNNVLNAMLGVGKEVPTHFFNLSYWVRKATDTTGKVKVDDKGKIKWAQTLMFQDVRGIFNKDNPWKDYAEKHGLSWIQRKNARGETYWDSDAEIQFWDEKIVALQRMLLNAGTALPFTYNSLIVCEAPNPSGGGNLSTNEIEECKRIWETIRDKYQMPYGASKTSADSFEDAPAPPTAKQDYTEKSVPLPPPGPSNGQPPSNAVEVPFPEYEMETGQDDLPF